LNIFDRWGNQVFAIQSIPPNQALQGWNGIYRGQAMDVGVYIYEAVLVRKDGVRLPVSGDVMLIR